MVWCRNVSGRLVVFGVGMYPECLEVFGAVDDECNPGVFLGVS